LLNVIEFVSSQSWKWHLVDGKICAKKYNFNARFSLQGISNWLIGDILPVVDTFAAKSDIVCLRLLLQLYNFFGMKISISKVSIVFLT